MHLLRQRLSRHSLRLTLLTIAIVTSGCGIRELGNTQALLTTAENRTVIVRPYSQTMHKGRKIIPTEIVCAEPSPDVVTIVSKSFNLSTGLEGVLRQPDINADVAGKAVAAMSIARAQALAQLTNRLATIQLLRDGLYRACEAYANGALSDVAYAVMLSGYSDVMVTLLTGELVAGNFGQSLAILGTSASGAATATADESAQDAAKVEANQKTLQQAQTDVATKRAERDQAAEALRSCKPDDTDCRSAKEKALQPAQMSLRDAEFTVLQALVTAMSDKAAGATGQSFASLAQAVGAVSQDQQDRSNVLGEVQRKFVERLNVDSFMVACLTVLGESNSSNRPNNNPLVKQCEQNLPKLLTAQSKLVQFKIEREHPTATIVESCRAAISKGLPTDIMELCKIVLPKVVEAETQIRLHKVGAHPGGLDDGKLPHTKAGE